MKIKLILCIMVLLISFSCKKKDAIPPEISISSPLAMSSYDVLDYITVSGLVSDESNIEWVEIKLLNSNLVPVVSPVLLTTTNLEYDFTSSLYIDDIHLGSGNYFVKVSAYDGENTTSRFIEILLSAVPLELKSTFVLSSSSNSFNLYELSGTSSILKESFSGVFQSGISNSYHQYLFFGSNLSGYGYNPDFNYIPWEIPVDFSFYDYFNKSVYSNEDQLHYISHGSGKVKAYDKNGNVIYSLLLNQGEYPEDILVYNQKVYLEVFTNAFNRDFVVFFKNSGLENCRISIDKDVVGILPKSDYELYVFTSTNGVCELYVYSINSNSFGLPRSLPSGTINDVAAVNDNEIIIAHETGLLRYTYTNNSLVPIVSEEFNKVKYDDLNDVLLVSALNELRYYSNLGAPIGIIINPENITDFYLYYNK